MKSTVHLASDHTEAEHTVTGTGKIGQVEIVDRLTGDKTVIASESPSFLDDVATEFAHAAEEMRRRRVRADAPDLSLVTP